MMETASTSETSVNFYQTTRRNNPEDSHLRAHRRGNLKCRSEKNAFGKYACFNLENTFPFILLVLILGL
jgi:hypothetical protein